MAAAPDAQQAALTAAQRQLFDAAERGDAAAVEALLGSGAPDANMATGRCTSLRSTATLRLSRCCCSTAPM